ncbi:hypothetical protein GNI_080180 [Gregarina niphandrodes]|uniref:Inner membrane complex protein n=1 Tax=Gregarina niphandrodes TaxID=110365 RepID=A0A023B6G1_GRENI|nr:hypothetical protein GNI_080180 [Gregarina niphandrodes]EZG66521.1 hypothetical protein GNI_080180 [Gregarina niphandrodes]|eukprot:XP_011130627.1 hypothetical protein GNI_080180 [Gregarina niphandrodes]
MSIQVTTNGPASNASEVYTTASLTGAQYSQGGNYSQTQYSQQGQYTSTGQQRQYASGGQTHQYTGGDQTQYTSGGQYASGQRGEFTTTGGQQYDTSSPTSVRKVSSVVVESTALETAPQDTERYVEVPTYEEQITYVPVKQVVEVPKEVPMYVVEYVDRVKEVPTINWVEKVVEVPEYHDVVVEKKVQQFVDRPREVIREVVVQKTRPVEQVVEVPGETIYIDKPFTTEKIVNVTRHVDADVPVVIAQTAKPIISESTRVVDVEVRDFQPEVIPVDVHVAKPVEKSLEAVGLVNSHHRLCNITSAQYNTILRSLNSNLQDHELPFVVDNGKIDFVRAQDAQHLVAPSGIKVEGWVSKTGSSTIIHSVPTSLNAPGASSLTHQVTSRSVSNTRLAGSQAMSQMGSHAMARSTMQESNYATTKQSNLCCNNPRAVTSGSVHSSPYTASNQYTTTQQMYSNVSHQPQSQHHMQQYNTEVKSRDSSVTSSYTKSRDQINGARTRVCC